MWRKQIPNAVLVGMHTGAATMETVWNFLKKLKMELPFDPGIPLLGIYPKNPKLPIQNNLCTPMFIAALFTNVGNSLSTHQYMNGPEKCGTFTQ